MPKIGQVPLQVKQPDAGGGDIRISVSGIVHLIAAHVFALGAQY